MGHLDNFEEFKRFYSAVKEAGKLDLAFHWELVQFLRREFEQNTCNQMNGLIEVTRDGRRQIEENQERFDDRMSFYETRLSLEAPVVYLKDSRYKNLFVSAWWGLMFFCSIGLAIMLLARHMDTILAWIGEGSLQSPGRVLILIFAGSLGVWVIRMIARLFLGATHRHEDAAERVVMIEAFLALLDNGNVSKEDLPLILPFIFRSGSTGIVQEETPPNLAVIQKLLSQFKSA